MIDAELLKQSAKDYITQIYKSHREEDIRSWESLIDVLFTYVDLAISVHHPENKEKKGEDFTPPPII